MTAMLFLKMSTISFYRHVFTVINMLCKFGEDMQLWFISLIALLSKLRILRPKVFKALPWQQVLSSKTYSSVDPVQVNIY